MQAENLSAALKDLDKEFPGLRSYLVNDDGSLRKHVNIFIDNQLIEDRTTLSDPLYEQNEIYIMQALSGG